mgnify:CR=1 FL=1
MGALAGNQNTKGAPPSAPAEVMDAEPALRRVFFRRLELRAERQQHGFHAFFP